MRFVSRFAARLSLAFGLVSLAALVACSSGGNNAGSAPPQIPPCPTTEPNVGASCQGPIVCTYDLSAGGGYTVVDSGALTATSHVAICPDVGDGGSASWVVETPSDAAVGEAGSIDAGATDAASDGDAIVDGTIGDVASDSTSDTATADTTAADTAAEAAADTAVTETIDAGTDTAIGETIVADADGGD
ncbi:MAG: hypothetical protein ACHREM_22670 [Polyangiales bacterium]